MVETSSLAALKAEFPVSRRQLIEALDALGYDFISLLQLQIAEGRSYADLARLHRVDAKWVARMRAKTNVAPRKGRPSVQVTEKDLLDAYRAAGSYSGAARALGMDRRTFTKRYQTAVRKVPPSGGQKIPRDPES